MNLEFKEELRRLNKWKIEEESIKQSKFIKSSVRRGKMSKV